MRIIFNDIIPPKGYKAINLFGVMFARNDVPVTEVTVAHERIHTRQMRETLYVFFYVWYVVEFLVKLALCLDWKEAYRNISFEREAFYYQGEQYYPYRRNRYEWIRRVFKGYE